VISYKTNLPSAVTLTAFFALAIVLIASPIDILSRLVSDDAYYYLNVARNLTSGFGFTFDQVNITDGFHPLWMATIVPIYWLFGDDIELALRLVLVLQASLAFLVIRIGILYSGSTRNPAYSLPIFLGVIFVLASPMLIWFNGLESALVITLLCWILYLDSKEPFLQTQSDVSRRLLFGVTFGLVMLARLDAAFLLIGLALWMLVVGDESRRWWLRPLRLAQDYWLSVLAFLLVLTPYFVWKLDTFGHLMPISGALKTTFPVPIFRPKVLIANAPFVVALMLSGLTLVNAHIVNNRKHEESIEIDNAQLNLLSGLWIGCLLHTIWTVVFMAWGTFQWHFAFHIPVYAFIFVRITKTDLFFKLRISPGIFSAAALAAIVGFGVIAWLVKGDHHRARLDAAQWAQQNLGPAAVVGLRDAGVFGYFSKTKTINLDGLINGYDYQEAILNGELASYMETRDIRYLADAYVPCDYSEYSIYVRAYRGRYFRPFIQARLNLNKSSEVYLSKPNRTQFRQKEALSCFVIWQYDFASKPY
jgi:hypothetical protein